MEMKNYLGSYVLVDKYKNVWTSYKR